jgi:hypothetical protein
MIRALAAVLLALALGGCGAREFYAPSLHCLIYPTEWSCQ